MQSEHNTQIHWNITIKNSNIQYYFLIGLPPIHMIRGPVHIPGGQPLFLQPPPPQSVVRLACGKFSETTSHPVMLIHCTTIHCLLVDCGLIRLPLCEMPGDVVHRPCYIQSTVQSENGQATEAPREVTPANMVYFPKGFQLQKPNLGHQQVYPSASVQHPPNAIPAQCYPFPTPVYVSGAQFYQP